MVYRKPNAEETEDLSFRDAMEKIEPMIEQVNNLYSQFIHGIERKIPTERRGQLERLIDKTAKQAKPAALRFKWQAILARFNTHKDRWDRLTREVESGKLKLPGAQAQRQK